MRTKIWGKMKVPPHVGEIIREDVIAALDLSVTKASGILGVSRPTLSLLLNERASLTWDMALRIEKAFGPKADHLMRMQFAHDEAHARKRGGSIKIKRYGRAIGA